MGCLSAKSDANTEQQIGMNAPEKVFEDDVEDKKDEQTKQPEAAKAGAQTDMTNTNVNQTEGGDLNKSGEGKKKRKRDYAAEYIREINECRSNPPAYAKKIENVLQFIKENKEKGGGTFEKEGMPKVALNRGEPAFREFIEKLKTIEPLPKLEARDDLKVDINEDPQKWTDKNLISEAVNNRKAAIKDTSNYNAFNFHFDVGSPVAETSFILQLVDDTPFKGSRQRNILNKDFKYVGISSLKVKNKNCGYFLFAN